MSESFRLIGVRVEHLERGCEDFDLHPLPAVRHAEQSWRFNWSMRVDSRVALLVLSASGQSSGLRQDV